MPIICSFNGIKVYMYYADHLPPHIHVKYGECEAIISIQDMDIIKGNLPTKQEKIILGWTAFHQDELIEDWQLAKSSQEVFKIEPF